MRSFEGSVDFKFRKLHASNFTIPLLDIGWDMGYDYRK